MRIVRDDRSNQITGGPGCEVWDYLRAYRNPQKLLPPGETG